MRRRSPLVVVREPRRVVSEKLAIQNVWEFQKSAYHTRCEGGSFGGSGHNDNGH